MNQSTTHTLLKARMARGATFGMNIYSTACMAIEVAGNWGLDFVFIDAEHTALGVDRDMEKLLLAASSAAIPSLVRVRGTLEWDIRKALEMGAAGVIVPQVHNAAQMRQIIHYSKFPPLGRRGGDSSVRSAGFAGPGFDWARYTQAENDRSVIVPMAESYEFLTTSMRFSMWKGSMQCTSGRRTTHFHAGYRSTTAWATPRCGNACRC